MSEIPEDIMQAARSRAEEWRNVDTSQYEGDLVEDLAKDFASSILAERQRIGDVVAKELHFYRENKGTRNGVQFSDVAGVIGSVLALIFPKGGQ